MSFRGPLRRSNNKVKELYQLQSAVYMWIIYSSHQAYSLSRNKWTNKKQIKLPLAHHRLPFPFWRKGSSLSVLVLSSGTPHLPPPFESLFCVILLLWKIYVSACFHLPKEIQRGFLLLQKKVKSKNKSLLVVLQQPLQRQHTPWAAGVSLPSSFPENYPQHHIKSHSFELCVTISALSWFILWIY